MHRVSTGHAVRPTAFPLPLVCPLCHAGLASEGEGFLCSDCKQRFPLVDEFPDFIVGERFEDETDGAQLKYEEQSNRDLAEGYLLPTFRRLWPNPSEPPRLLSLGCGAGTDVDVLCDAGFDCVGIDCGNRTAAWPRRVEKNRFLLANGQNLPFENESFDGIFCGCVFPHVGVVGDSYQVASDYQEQRLRLAQEMSRVLRPGGKILVSSPNRLFPFDIFHGRTPGSYRPRPYWPRDPFLLSVADYRSLFYACGLSKIEPQPVAGYWSFFRSKRSWKGYLLGLPIRSVFWLASRPELRSIRSSPISPWIVVLIDKAVEEAR